MKHSQEFLDALEAGKDSEEFLMFTLANPDLRLQSRTFVKEMWHLVRDHVVISSIKITDSTRVSFTLSAALGSVDYEFLFWESSREADIVVDCIDMAMRYQALFKALSE